MKVVVVKNNLKRALEIVSRAGGEISSLPVLKNILIRTGNSSLDFSGTNLELAIKYQCSAKVIEEGELTAPAVILNSIVGNLSSEVINLELKKDVLIIRTDNYEASINTLPVSEFPIIPSIQKGEELGGLKINADVLKDSLAQVVSATKISDLRPEINGILFSYKDGGLKLVGTDSFRLAERSLGKDKFSSDFKEELEAIVPLKTVQEVVASISSGSELEVYFDKSQVLFKNDQVAIISRLIDGKFPDYKQIIPEEVLVEAVVRKEDLINALKVTSVLAGRINDVEIRINAKFLELSSVNQGVGENKYLVPAKVKGNSFGVRFNAGYLLAGVKSQTGESVLIGFNQDDKPSLIRTVGDSSYLYILMPVKG